MGIKYRTRGLYGDQCWFNYFFFQKQLYHLLLEKGISHLGLCSPCILPVSFSDDHHFERGGGCYLHVVPLVTSFRRLNTPSTCLPWIASRIGGRRDPGG